MAAEYHSIYFLAFAAESLRSIEPNAMALEADESPILVLRVPGRHISWPQGAQQSRHYEHTLLEKCPREPSANKVYDKLTEGQQRPLVEQLAGLAMELQDKQMACEIGGRLRARQRWRCPRPSRSSRRRSGRRPDIDKTWPAGERSVKLLNPC